MDQDSVYATYAQFYALAYFGALPGITFNVFSTNKTPTHDLAMAMGVKDGKDSQQMKTKSELIQHVTNLLK